MKYGWLRSWAGLTTPQFGQLCVWVLVYLALSWDFGGLPIPVGERVGPVTVVSFLPDVILESKQVFYLCKLLLFFGGACWVLQVGISVSPWLTAVSYIMLVSMAYYENSPQCSHAFNLVAILLIIHAGWYTFYRRQISQSVRDGVFFSRNVYPLWVFHISIFCIAIFHTYAGLSKIAASGTSWANGTSLQLWTQLFGRKDWLPNELILSHRKLAQTLQVLTLVIETGAVIAIFSKWLRYIVGVCLLTFYVGVILNFGFSFHLNAILVAIFFLPMLELNRELARTAAQNLRVTLTVRPPNLHKLLCALRPRVDLFSVAEISAFSQQLKTRSLNHSVERESSDNSLHNENS